MTEEITLTSAELHRNIRTALRAVTAGQAVTITRYGHIEAVLVSPERYAQLLELERQNTGTVAH